MSQKVALVTGGMGGIGTAICQTLAKKGYKVATTYHKGGDHEAAKLWQNEQKHLGYEFAIFYCDVADFESCGVMTAAVKEVLGPIDILINNAGIAEDASLRKMSFEQWQNVIRTDLDSVFNVTRHVINDMLNNKFGRVVNISSINGQKGQFGQTNYAAAKAGMHGFTKSLALEVAAKGITVNTISPGYIDTEMMAAVSPDVLQQIINTIPVGRLGDPKEIARVVEFLVDEQSAFMTGAEFTINGGQYMM